MAANTPAQGNKGNTATGTKPAAPQAPEPTKPEPTLAEQIAALEAEEAERVAKLTALREQEAAERKAAAMAKVSEKLAEAQAARDAGSIEDTLSAINAARDAVIEAGRDFGIKVPKSRGSGSGSGGSTSGGQRQSRVRDDILKVVKAHSDVSDWSAGELRDEMAEMGIFAPNGNKVSPGAIEVAVNGGDWRNGNVAGLVAAGHATVTQESNPRRWQIRLPATPDVLKGVTA